MRVLTVTNITPDATTPARGNFVRNQVQALHELGVEVELLSFPVGKSAYLPAVRSIRRRLKQRNFDLVHAHYGLAGWCALLAGAKPLVVTFHGTDIRHRIVGPTSRLLTRRLALTAGVSQPLFETESGRPGLNPDRGRVAVLPCGADLNRFRSTPRDEARAELGLDPDGRYLLFPASPSREVKRFDLAQQLAEVNDAVLLTAGNTAEEEMPTLVNAVNAVVVTSDNEGFGLAAVEALACDVPVLSTPVGIAPTLLGGLESCLVADFSVDEWSRVLAPHLDDPDPRVEGRGRAEWFSARAMAGRVLEAYKDLLGTDLE